MIRQLLVTLLSAAATLFALSTGSSVPGFFIETSAGVWESRGTRLPVQAGPYGVALGSITLDLEGAAFVAPVPDKSTGTVRFYCGGYSSPGLPISSSVSYRHIYPGISLRISLEGNLFKSEYIVEPGADPRTIRFRYRGARSIRLQGDDLMIETSEGVLQEPAPIVFQDLPGGGRRAVAGAYKMGPDATVSFEIGSYDRSLSLVIDPYVLNNGSYLGGSGIDEVTSMAVDAGGVYLAGLTESNFPANSIRPRAGGVEAFVIKTNPAGTQVLWATYLGGSAEDRAQAITVDSAGQVRVAGFTTSGDFPLLGAQQSIRNGSRDAFLTKLTATGALAFSTYFGGSGADEAFAIAVSGSGETWIAGGTDSVDLPTLAPYQGTKGGGTDALLARFTDSGALAYSSYLGGSANDSALGIALDSSGAPVVTGGTYSANFPQLGVIRPHAGGQDAFVTRFNVSGSGRVFSTLLGGADRDVAGLPEKGTAVAVGSDGSIYVTGTTCAFNFPMVQPLQGTFGGGTSDSFIARLSSSGAILASSYYGGSSTDAALAIALGSDGSLYVGGSTASPDLRQLDSIQSAPGGQTDLFLARFSPSLNAQYLGTYIGGNGLDTLSALSVSGTTLYISGFSSSSSLFPGTTLLGPFDAFLARYTEMPVQMQLTSTVPIAFAVTGENCSAGSYTAGASFTWKIGASCTVSFAAVQLGSNVRYVFTNWSDASTLNPRTFTAQPGLAALALNFRTDYPLTRLVSPAGAGTVTATPDYPDFYYPASSAVQLTATASSGYRFTGWSGNASGTAAQSSVVMSGARSVTANFACSFGVSSTSLSLASGASSSAVNVTTAPACLWSAAAPASWVTLSAPSFSGPGTVSVQAAGNTTAAPRSATLTVAGQSVTVTQSGCTYSVTPSWSASFSPGASPAVITLATGPTCTWSAASSAAWARVTSSGAGTGSAGIQLAIDANPGVVARSAQITVGGQSTTVTQAAIACSYTSAASWSGTFSASPATASIVVTTQSPCSWTAVSNAGWARVTSPASGTGAATVQIAVDANPGLTARSAQLTVAGQTLTVAQAGIACSYSAAPSWSAPFASGSGAASVAVTAPAGCSWSSSSNAAWAKVMAGSTGSGSSSVQIAIDPNSTASQRTAQITVAGQTISLVQAGKVYCPVSLSLPSLSATWTGAKGILRITAAANCTWEASSNSSWIQIYPLNGIGNADLQYTVFPNFGTQARSAAVAVNSAAMTVQEGANPATYNQRFAGMMYFNFFGRLASQAEIDFQAGVLNGGASYGELVFNFFQVPEFNNGGRFIAGLYVGLLNRDAEYGGWLFQRNALATGVVLQTDLVANFIGSDEYKLVFGTPNNEDFVRLLYRHILLREGGPNEITNQAANLYRGLSRIQLASNFLNSDEFRSGSGARLTVFLLYACTLFRDGSPGEVSAARSQITDLTSVRRLADALIASPEFTDLLR